MAQARSDREAFIIYLDSFVSAATHCIAVVNTSQPIYCRVSRVRRAAEQQTVGLCLPIASFSLKKSRNLIAIQSKLLMKTTTAVGERDTVVSLGTSAEGEEATSTYDHAAINDVIGSGDIFWEKSVSFVMGRQEEETGSPQEESEEQR